MRPYVSWCFPCTHSRVRAAPDIALDIHRPRAKTGLGRPSGNEGLRRALVAEGWQVSQLRVVLAPTESRVSNRGGAASRFSSPRHALRWRHWAARVRARCGYPARPVDAAMAVADTAGDWSTAQHDVGRCGGRWAVFGTDSGPGCGGLFQSATGDGLVAQTSGTTSSAVAVFADAGGGNSYAGVFLGPVNVAGCLQISGSNFQGCGSDQRPRGLSLHTSGDAVRGPPPQTS
jgi:hypothetical protein